MNDPPADHSAFRDTVWQRYRCNFPRHVLGVARHLQADIMHTLAVRHGHRQLRLAFEPWVSLAGGNGRRLGEIADLLGISRQAANQAANQVEAAGLIRRVADASDGRARRVVLTEKGKRVRRQGVEAANRAQRELAQLVGERHLQPCLSALAELHAALDLPPVPDGSAQLGGLLPRLADYINHRLMELTRQRGHTGLKLSHGQALTLIGPEGGRIQQIAAIQQVSKQAISAIATELQALGYLTQTRDPADARHKLLQFTARGRQLIGDSVAAVDQLETEFGAALGPARFAMVRATLHRLYDALQLEAAVFETKDTDADTLLQMARELVQQLGPASAGTLGRLLLSSTQAQTHSR